MGSGNVDASNLEVSGHTRIALPCRLLLSGYRRRTGNSGGINAARGKVNPACVSGITQAKVQVYSLLRHSIFTRGLHTGLTTGGRLFAGVCRIGPLRFSSVFGRCCRCNRRLGGCIASASLLIGSRLSTNGGMLFRNTRNAVLSVSSNACPCIASSGSKTTNTPAKTNIKPGRVSAIINVYGTCYAQIKTNPFPARLRSRVNTRVHRINRRCKIMANHPQQIN